MNDMVGISGELESSGNGSGTAFGHCSCCCRCKDCGGLAGSTKIQFQLNLKVRSHDVIFSDCDWVVRCMKFNAILSATPHLNGLCAQSM